MKDKIGIYGQILFCAMLLLIAVSCESNAPKNDGDGVPTMAHPDFDADSAFAFVKAQTDFGPRVPNSAAHQQCADYLKWQLERYCDTVSVQHFRAVAYDKTVLNGQNIMGSFAPEKSLRVLLAAHWDSRHIADFDPIEKNRTLPIDGANDGASGVGVLLEVARQLSIKNPQIGVDILFFDAEDYGTPSSENLPGDWWCLGSQHWSKLCKSTGYKAEYGILLDMVGAANATFYHEQFSTFYASDVVSKVWGTANQLGFGSYFLNEASNPITDDHLYVNQLAHLKMVNIIHQDKSSHTGFPAVWHTQNDNINNIDKTTLAAVGKTVLAVIYNEVER